MRKSTQLAQGAPSNADPSVKLNEGEDRSRARRGKEIEIGCAEASQAQIPNGDRLQRLIDEFYGKGLKRKHDDEDGVV